MTLKVKPFNKDLVAENQSYRLVYKRGQPLMTRPADRYCCTIGIARITRWNWQANWLVATMYLCISIPGIRKWRRRPGIDKCNAMLQLESDGQCRPVKPRRDHLGKRYNHRESAIPIWIASQDFHFEISN